MDDYDRLINTWDQAAERVRQGIFAYNPLTPSQWIYHPDGFTKERQVQHVWFRRTFQTPSNLKKAEVQLYGDTHVKLYVNGKFLGEQYVRRNLSAPVNPKLVQLYDITAYLKDGENCIAVEAHNYGGQNRNLEPGGPARCGGFNLYGELKDSGGNIVHLLSDESWKVTDRVVNGWLNVKFDDSGWRSARSDPKPMMGVTVPDFTKQYPGFVNRLY